MSVFAFVDFAFSVISNKLLTKPMARSFPGVFSRSCIILGLMFKSLIHLEFIFVYAIKWASNFILLHVDIKFSPYHFWKTILFFSCVFLEPLHSYGQRSVEYTYVVYFWAFYSVPLVYITINILYCTLKNLLREWISH